DDERIAHRAAPRQILNDLRDLCLHLSASDVDTDDVFRFLIDNGVDRNGGLARLAVADDQFALSPTDWRHGVDRLDAGLKRHFYRLTLGYPRGIRLHRP